MYVTVAILLSKRNEFRFYIIFINGEYSITEGAVVSFDKRRILYQLNRSGVRNVLPYVSHLLFVVHVVMPGENSYVAGNIP